MALGDEIAGMAQADFGRSILIGLTPVTGIFSAPGKSVDHYDGAVITTAPTLLVDIATAALVEENSTIITINNVDYQATDKTPDGAGLVVLSLTTDF